MSSNEFDTLIREFQDRGIIWLLESRENLRALFTLANSDLACKLDFASATRLNRSLIAPELHKQEADVLYRVPYSDGQGEVMVYVLIEHQSTLDRWIPLRLLRFMVAVWESQCRTWDDMKVPQEQRLLAPVVPLVFYTGHRPWKDRKGLPGLIDAPAALTSFIPVHATLYLMLDETDSQHLTGTALAYALSVLQVETAPLGEFMEVLERAVISLEELPPQSQAEWRRAMWFLCQLIRHRRAVEEKDVLLNLVINAAREHRKEVTLMTMSGAEADIAKGLKQGLEQGREEERRRMLILILESRFGAPSPALLGTLQGWPKDGLTELVQRAATAQTLEAFQQSLT